MKWLLHTLIRILFRFRAYNTTVLDTPGPVLLIPNHVSWLDWVFIGTCLDDDWKFVVSSTTAEKSWIHRLIMLNRRTFPVDTSSPFAVKRMAEHLGHRGRLVLFAEGRMSRTGGLMKLFDGTGFLLYKTRARVITAYQRGAHRFLFSPHPGWHQCFPRVSVHFSDVIPSPELQHLSTIDARHRYTNWLRDRMVQHQFEVEMALGPTNLPAAILETARHRPRFRALQDVSQNTLSYRRLFIGANLLARQWRNRMAAAGDHPAPQRIGVLLPNVNATPVVLLSLWAAAKQPAMLNFSTGMTTMLTCAKLAGIRHVITSRAFVERVQLDVQPFVDAGIHLIYLEDVRQAIGGLEKLLTALRQWWRLQISSGGLGLEDTAVILFTSGSEGTPKGVDLTQKNILANVRQATCALDILDTDRFFNALPLFHSFGLTAGLLLPLLRGAFVFLYPSPLHYRMIPSVFYNLDCTILFGTNTFLKGYARKAHPYDFRNLRYVVAGAEKLQRATVDTWCEQFGVRIAEGYGVTECSPIISVNTPIDVRVGTAGHLVPGMECRIEPVEGVEEGGRLLVKGPNVMRGYLNPEANAGFKALGGWYDTGDLARVDEAGFLHILGRLKRFAKISGEMVSLTAVEEALHSSFPQYGQRFQVAVLARPDPEKGEALIAVTNERKLRLDEVRAAIKAKGLTNLFVPREINFLREIPVLGTGKVDYRGLTAKYASPA